MVSSHVAASITFPPTDFYSTPSQKTTLILKFKILPRWPIHMYICMLFFPSYVHYFYQVSQIFKNPENGILHHQLLAFWAFSIIYFLNRTHLVTGSRPVTGNSSFCQTQLSRCLTTLLSENRNRSTFQNILSCSEYWKKDNDQKLSNPEHYYRIYNKHPSFL